MVRLRARHRPRPRLDLETDRFFEIADDAGLSYDDKLGVYRELADAYFETERYEDFCATSLAHIDEIVLDWVEGPDFDDLLVETVRAGLPPARTRPVHRPLPWPGRPLGPG